MKNVGLEEVRMRKATFSRFALMGSVAACGLVFASTAQAVEAKFGDVQIILDTTVSTGVSMRTADRNAAFLPQVNGGSLVDTRVPYNYGAAFGATNFGDLTAAPVQGLVSLAAVPSGTNRAGSINGDDGRLNFDRGDLTGATFKASHDLQITWENFTVFARWFEFYDAVMNGNPGQRSGFSDEVRGTVGRDAKLLDLFISGKFDVAGLDLNVRAGKQVISWGEGTFILNGINVVNPIDVTAFRRPGSEIKEGLVPVNSISASINTPIEGLGLSGFYMLDFEPYEIDAAGTPFSGADTIDASNVDPRGSINSFLSGSRFSGTFRRNCTTNVLTGALTYGSGTRQLANLTGQTAAYDAKILAQCASSPYVNYQQAIDVGLGEFVKNTTLDGPTAGNPYNVGDQNYVGRDGNNEADASGQFGLRANYYSEALGTEFGAYYMNYHSRLPFVSFKTKETHVQISAQAPDGSAAGRAVLPLGCLYNAASAAGILAQTAAPGVPNGYAALAPAGVANADNALYITGAAQKNLFAATTIADPNNYEGLMASLIAPLMGANPAELADIVGDAAASGTGRADLNNLARINCLLALVNSSSVGGTPMIQDGAELLSANNEMDIFLDYPEDIELFGLSFNTVIAGWGVQAEASYRPNAPFQIDTDELTIASAIDQCAGFGVGSAGYFFQLANTLKAANCNYDNLVDADAGGVATAAPGKETLKGYFRNEMFTAQIGTTASFNQSEWWVDFLGAENAVFLTEIGLVHVPNVEDSYLNDGGAARKTDGQYQNTGCQGSDLALGSFLGLSSAPSRQCRPDSTSAGYVLVGRLSYANVADTGFTLTPTIVFSHDFYGTTPAPYSNYVQDRMSANFSVGAELNNNLRLNLGYTSYWGGHLNNKAQDQDFASFSASYSF